jgi:hypothetical protein
MAEELPEKKPDKKGAEALKAEPEQQSKKKLREESAPGSTPRATGAGMSGSLIVVLRVWSHSLNRSRSYGGGGGLWGDYSVRRNSALQSP